MTTRRRSPTRTRSGRSRASRTSCSGSRPVAEELGWTADSIDANLSPDKQVADIATMVTQGEDGIASWTLDPGRRRGRIRPGPGRRHSGGRRELRGHGHRRDGVVGDQPVRRGLADRGARGRTSPRRSPARRCSRSAVRPSRRSRPTSGASPRTRRRTGSRSSAKAHNTKDTAATAQPIVADLLTKNPDVRAIWAYNDASALGASAALIADGREVYDGSGDGVIVFGQNGDVDAITAIREHRLTGTIDPTPSATGWALIKALSGFVGKGKADEPAQGARGQERAVDAGEHRRLHRRRASATTRSTRCRSWTSRRAEQRAYTAPRSFGCPSP